jgi:hypothetical protein
MAVNSKAYDFREIFGFFGQLRLHLIDMSRNFGHDNEPNRDPSI